MVSPIKNFTKKLFFIYMDCIFNHDLIFFDMNEPLKSVDEILSELGLNEMFHGVLVEVGDVGHQRQDIAQEFL